MFNIALLCRPNRSAIFSEKIAEMNLSLQQYMADEKLPFLVEDFAPTTEYL
jgi:hypothetical protein